MKFYSAFGLTFCSEVDLYSFFPLQPQSDWDVKVKFGQIDFPEETNNRVDRVICAIDDGILFYWHDVGGFLLMEGRSVIIQITTEEPRYKYIEAILMGPVMGMLLYQRNHYRIFHSSVVSKPDGRGALAFMATMGGGKSSMAAAMLRSGYSHVSDDLLAAEFEDDRTVVQSGFPGMKLCEDSSGHLVEDGENLPMMGDPGDYEKRFLQVRDNFMPGKQPLHSVFLLEFGDVPEPKIIPLSKKEAIFFLMPHWYGALFRGELLPILGRDRHFKECADLAGRVSVYRLIRPRSLERIDESVWLIDNFRKENAGERA